MQNRQTRWGFFLNNFRFTNILIASIVLFGLFSVLIITKESTPEINVPIAVVTTSFPGANAQDVEELVTKPIEDSIINVEGINKTSSVSRSSLSNITIEFDPDVDSLKSITDIKDKVDLVVSELPDDANDPIVQKISFSNTPILTISLAGPYPLEQISQFGKQLQERIERVPGVTQVQVIGNREPQVSVLVRQEDVDTYGISFNTVISAISQANADIPAGTIETANEEFLLRLAGRVTSVEDVKNVPVTVFNNAVVFVRDVADVQDSFTDVSTLSRVGYPDKIAEQAVSLQIFKIDGADIITTVTEVEKEINLAYSQNILPEEVNLVYTEDSAEIVRTDLGNLLNNGIQTVIIVMFMLMLFLGWRSSLLAGVAIPMTFLITFITLQATGYTLNIMTLFSLILALGILVDGAVVITEAIYSGIQKGKTTRQASLDAIKEFQIPLVAGTLTTIFAFVPMLLTSGIIGEFIKSIPVTITIVLLSSLFVAFAVIPHVGKYVYGFKTTREEPGIVKGVRLMFKELQQKWYRRYNNALTTLISSRKKKRRLLAVLGALFVGSVMLPILGILPVNMFPPSDEAAFFVEIELPIGTTLEQTSEFVKDVEAHFEGDTRINSFVTNIGSGGGNSDPLGGGGVTNSHLATIIINLQKDRSEKSFTVVNEYQNKLFPIFGEKVTARQLSSGPGDAAPIEARIYGNNLATLDELADMLAGELKNIDGTQNVNKSIADTNGEFVLDINRIQARLYGITTQQVAAELRSIITGAEATIIRGVNEFNDDADVIVRSALRSEGLQTAARAVNIEDIQAITFATPQGDVPLSNFATINIVNNRDNIQHRDGKRVITISSYVKEGKTAQQIVAKLQEKIDTNITIPDGYQVVFGGENEDIQKSFTDMFRAFILAIFMIAALLVLQFKSYRQPFFILVTIPLALIGVLPGLVLLGQPLSFPGLIGIVALAGIVVNNAIILIDRMNTNRRKGMDIEAAIIDAGNARVQPIILTTITTVCGILPLAISNPTWGPLGYSIFFGLLFSTVTTLFVVPVLYHRFAEKQLD